MAHIATLGINVPVGRLRSRELVYVAAGANVKGTLEGPLRRAIEVCISAFQTDFSITFGHGARTYRADLHFNGVEPYYEVERVILA